MSTAVVQAVRIPRAVLVLILALILSAISGWTVKEARGAYVHVTVAETNGRCSLQGLSPVKRRQCLEMLRNSQPVFIFLPGILGSKLKSAKGAGYAWGSLSSDTSELDFTVNPAPLQAEELGTFNEASSAFSSDIYGKMARVIRRLDVGNVPHFLFFPYDWRQNNKDTAELFDKWLREDVADKIKGRHVTFIAHSMGGLVYRYWYSQLFKNADPQKYDFVIDEVLFLAVPNHGAPQALYRVSNAILFDGFNEVLAKNFLRGNALSDLEKIGYTFPSLYQLLPQDPCLIVFEGKDCETGAIPIFEIETWKNLHLLDTYAQKTGKPVAQLLPLVAQHLKTATEFHDALIECDEIDNATFIYSEDDQKTRISAVVDADGRFTWQTGKGDQTVPMEIAKCSDRVRTQFRHKASGTHVDITHSDSFVQFVTELRDTALMKGNAVIAQQIRSDSEYAMAYARSGNMLEIPVSQYFRNTPETELVKQANSTIETTMLNSGNQPMYALQGTPNQNILAVSLAKSDEQKALAAHNVSYFLFKEADKRAQDYGVDGDQFPAVMKLFNTASQFSAFANTITGTLPASTLAKIKNTNGAIQFRLNNVDEAKAQWEAAATLGSTNAQNNLKSLQQIER